MKVLEAMASGTPLVASNLPVVAGLARHEIEALLVAPGSAKAIKDALLRLDESPGLAASASGLEADVNGVDAIVDETVPTPAALRALTRNV